MINSTTVRDSAHNCARSGFVGAAALGIYLALLLFGCASLATDAKVTAQVRTLLAQSPALSSSNTISVQTVQGVVYLRGIASTPYQIAEAESIAHQVPGVVDVQNQLAVDNSP